MECVAEEVNKNQSMCQILQGFEGVIVYLGFSSLVSYTPTENNHGVEQLENKPLALLLLKLIWRT